MNELALFAGAGGGILGGTLLGWKTVCAVEINAYCRAALMQRQNDGILPPFPIWDDVRTFDGRPWRGIVDVVSGGFPCKGISAAGRGDGLDHPESGLWSEQRRIVGEVGPRYVLVENSPVLTSRGLGVVLGDLAALGYDARWGVLSAADAIWLDGTPCLDHLRERIWIVATNANLAGQDRARLAEGRRESLLHTSGAFDQREGSIRLGGEEVGISSDADAGCGRCGEPEGREGEQQRRAEAFGTGQENADCASAVANGWRERVGRRERGALNDDSRGSEGTYWWQSEPGMGRVVHGLAYRVERVGALGNGQLPQVVKLAWETLT